MPAAAPSSPVSGAGARIGPARGPAPVLRALALGHLTAVALIALIAVLALAASLATHRQRALDESLARATTLAQATAAELGRVDVVLRAAAGEHERRDGPGRSASERSGDMLEAHASLLRPSEGLLAVDAEGRVQGPSRRFVSGDATLLQPLLDQARLLDPGLLVSEPLPDAAGDGGGSLLLARRLTRADGSFAGLVVAVLPASGFLPVLASIDPGPQGMVALRSRTLRLLAWQASSGPLVGAAVGSTTVSDELRTALAREPRSGSFVAVTALDGVERANGYHAIDGVPLLVVVGRAVADERLAWWREVAAVMGLAVLASLVLAASYGAARRAWRAQAASRAALQDELARERAVLQTATDGIHVLDREGRLVELSDSFAAMLGYERDAMIGLNHAAWDPRYEETGMRARFAAFEVGRRYRFTTRHRRRDGRWIEVEVVSIGARIGASELLVCSARDVGERERATRALRASEALLERTGRIAAVGGWEEDLRDGRLRWSHQLKRLLDLDAGFQPQHGDLERHFRADGRPRIEGALRAARSAGVAWDLELPVVTEQGRTLWVRTIGEVEREGGQPVRLVGALQDITERLQRAAELRREREMREQVERHAAELNALLRERNEMLDVLAHEVRQPLNNASAALQNLAKSLPDNRGEAAGAAAPLARAQNVMSQVLASIDNTLAAAALLLRTGPIARDDVDIDTLLAVAIGDMPAAVRGRFAIERTTTARTVSVDPSLMRLALRNLLANALKYSPPQAPVTITIGESDDPLALLIDVADRGPGVDPELLPRLFERGTRSRRRDAPPGHGLGLYIVRRAMELHGGRVELVKNGPDGATMRLVVVEAQDG